MRMERIHDSPGRQDPATEAQARMGTRITWLRSVVTVLLLIVSHTVALAATPLIDAVRSGNVTLVRTLLSEGADVDAPQPDGATALHWAVHLEEVAAVDLLIQAGADVNVANDLAVTPLLMACTSGHGVIVERLLAAGADLNKRLSSGETALMRATRAGSLQAVKGLLARGADIDTSEGTFGQTALMWAVANGHPAIVRTLIESGADVHARSDVRRVVVNLGGSRSAGTGNRETGTEIDQGGNTPLLFTARSGDVESAQYLVAAGADVNDVGADGNTALVVAAHSGRGSVAAFLLEQGTDPNAAPLGYTALHAAVLRGTLADRGVRNSDPLAGVPLMEALLAHGADPNVRFTKGTPVRRWSHDFVLHQRWAGATPFWLAAKFLEVDMMRVLAANGADPSIPSYDGTTPLIAAAGFGYSRGGGGAFIRDRRDFSSYNPVASAAIGRRIPADEERLALAAVRLAVERGADVNGATETGDTALHAAASHGMNTVVRFLAESGANLDARNRAGQTPLSITRGTRVDRAETAALLRELGATDPGRSR